MKLTKPYPYQRQGIDKIHECKGRTLLADEMGLGKSLQALFYAYEAKRWPILIICPAFLKWNWEREVQTHLGMRAEVLQGRRPPRGHLARSKIYIINFDILHNWVDHLQQLDIQLIIIDECQNLVNRGTLRTKAFNQIRRGVPEILGISGTPFENRPIEFYPILHAIWPKKFPSYFEFGEDYCEPRFVKGEIQYKGAANTKHLNKRLLRYGMIRRLKKNVLKDLPDKTTQIVPLDIERRKEYDAAERDLVGWLMKKSPVRAIRARKSERFLRYGYLKRLAAELKLAAVINWFENWFDQNPGKKIIAGGWHLAILKELHKHFSSHSVLVTGQVHGAKRQARFDTFQMDPRCTAIFANYKSAGTGWNGTAASAVAHIELAWNPSKHNQFTDRGHRIGQTRGLMVYFLIAHGTIEERNCKLLQDKQAIQNAVLDGRDNVQDFDIFDQLEQELRTNARKPSRRATLPARA